jgi:hypothetical protein
MEHVSLQHKIPERLLMIFSHCCFHMYDDDGAVSRETDIAFGIFGMSSDCTSLIYRVLTICALFWHVKLITHLLPTFVLWLAVLCLGFQPETMYLCILTNFCVVICFRQMLGLNFHLS